MDKVYIVTTGDYESYSIIAVCASKEIAEQIAEKCKGIAEVEEWELNKIVPKIYKWIAFVNIESGTLVWVKETFVRLYNYEEADSQGNVFSLGSTKEEAIENAHAYRASYLAQRKVM